MKIEEKMMKNVKKSSLKEKNKSTVWNKLGVITKI